MGRKRAAGVIAVDTSALLAIAFKEPEREAFSKTILDSDVAFVSAVSIVEARMVTHGRRGESGLEILDGILSLPNFEIVSPGPAELDIAHDAFVTYGKGSGHPARLNFGDLFSYALAKARGVPLLYKGDDFAHTDVPAATG
jgi:ribonuclease VapC